MRYVIGTLVVIVALIGVVAVVGWFLPVGHVASRSATVNAPQEAVYGLIADVVNYSAWRPDVSRVEVLSGPNEKLKFREHSSNGPIVMQVDEATPPTRMVTRIADPDQPFGGTWTFEITRADSGSTITITERGEVYNPIFRFMSRFVFGHTAGLEAYLKALTTRLGG